MKILTRNRAARHRRSRVCRPVFLVAAILPMAMSAGLPSAASASGVSHVFSGTIGSASSSPPNPYPISEPNDVAVDQATHDIYVTDPANHRVEKFDSDGAFLLMFGLEVDHTTGGNVCTVASGDICQAGVSGSSSGAFEGPEFVAVDNSGGPSSGDVYVGDTGTNLVEKFDPSGQIISGWGVNGQKDGSDATNLPGFGPTIFGLSVAPSGDLFVGGTHYTNCCGAINYWQYTQNGTYVEFGNTSAAQWLKVDQKGNVFFSDGNYIFWKGGVQATSAGPTEGFEFDPSSNELYQDTGAKVNHYSGDCNPENGLCDPVDSFGSGDLFGARGVGVDGMTHTVYVANSASNDVAVFGDARPIVKATPPTNVGDASVTITGHIDPAGRGNISACKFEYGFDTSYGTTVPCMPDPASNPPGSNFTEPTDVSATVSGLSPGTTDHYRLVVENAVGASEASNDEVFTTTQRPAIDGLASAHLTATSADLNAQVNPNGLETTYHFIYGPTVSYGQTAPVPDGVLAQSYSDQAINIHLEELVPHGVYHYRLIAENADGTTTSVDHTFNFYPPSCPNENVRQQVEANFLPDCRAYELVSPGDAAGTQFYPDGPNTGYATGPSRFAYTGLWSTIPEAGGEPIDSNGDLYVATRTATGWESRYVGIPAREASVDGGPPMGLPNSAPGPYQVGLYANQSFGGTYPDQIQNSVMTDLGMNKFLDWNIGNRSSGSGFGADHANPTPVASNAPYVWGADGKRLGRWPTSLNAAPPGQYPEGSHYFRAEPLKTEPPLQTSPGGVHALDCVAVQNSGSASFSNNFCPGDVTASADLSHFVFATRWNVFAPGGQLSAPGSVYDNDITDNTVTVASKVPAGDDIPSEPGDSAGDPLQIPAVSENGSHILMAAGGTGPCGLPNCPEPPGGDFFGGAIRTPMQVSHLYMRVDGAVTYDVSKGADVSYVGMTGDGSKVFFTTDQRLTPEDQDSSSDLYMWSESTDALTLVSAGLNGEGNSDSCDAGFVAACGVQTYSNASYCSLSGGIGGNCRSDSSIASKSGDIYFFSPELLDGSRGIANQENLYVYRDGHDQFVATFTAKPFCFETPNGGFADSACADTPAARMEVTPDGSHMGLITNSQITQYNNDGHLEMYTYEPSSESLICVSCIPSGEPPTSDVVGSQDGLFMTNDGRAFFTTEDALVHSDTNNALDVYEYVDGRPQLITSGTGETSTAGGAFAGIFNKPGLLGVSADGTDVYFSTVDTLVPQDHNGLFLKIYDARTGGGFPAPAPPPPCAAADECHGAGGVPPVSLQRGSGTSLGSGGNVTAERRTHHRHRASHKRHHRRVKHVARKGRRSGQ